MPKKLSKRLKKENLLAMPKSQMEDGGFVNGRIIVNDFKSLELVENRLRSIGARFSSPRTIHGHNSPGMSVSIPLAEVAELKGDKVARFKDSHLYLINMNG